jgi:hypothetical protein
MFNPLNRKMTIKATRSPIALSVFAIAITILAACGESGSAPSGANAPRAAASSNAGGQVVITGAIERTYTPGEITAVKIDKYIGINMNEQFPCGVTLQFPIDIQPGTYSIGDRLHQPINDIFAEYGISCNRAGILVGAFKSTKGTLTLTASGAK